jgi:hypothetical protein
MIQSLSLAEALNRRSLPIRPLAKLAFYRAAQPDLAIAGGPVVGEGEEVVVSRHQANR